MRRTASRPPIGIVGAGPAGAAAAARLAGAGRSVLLFHDPQVSEKPCGGGIPQRGVLGLPDLLDSTLPRIRVTRLVLIAPSGNRATVELDEPVHVFARQALDGYLRRRAERAGARLVVRRVVRLEPAAGGWRLTDAAGEIHEVATLAGADGVNSLVRRAVLGPHRRPALTQALGWYVRGRTDDRLIIGFEAGLSGYHWSFPRPDHVAVGACAPLGTLRAADLRARAARFLERLPDGLAGEPGDRDYYAALIPAPDPGPGGRLAVEGPGWALLGDAAGAVDPLTREGIHYALESGLLWAEALLDPARGSYTARFHARFPRELARAAGHVTPFFAPAFTERLVRYAESSRAIRAVVSDLVAGRQPYGTLKRRLLGCALPLAVSLAVARVRRPGGPAARAARAS